MSPQPAAWKRVFPNLLSGSRLILAPWLAWLLFQQRWQETILPIVLITWSDAFDGYFARRWNVQSKLGLFLDPMADKLLLVLTFLALGATGVIPVWMTVLVLGRDALILLLSLMGLALTRLRSFPPSIWGKLSTICQMFYAVARVFDVSRFYSLPPVLAAITLWVTAGVTVWSGIHYFWTAWGLYRDQSITR